MQKQAVQYIEYGSNFSKAYVQSLDETIMEIKVFCVQIATAYGIIHIDKCKNIPRIKAVVYYPNSDTYYIHINDLNFLPYLSERVYRFFVSPEFGFENFTISHDEIDDENFVIEVNLNDESTILNNDFFKVKPISI
jgi:hypothetical protein